MNENDDRHRIETHFKTLRHAELESIRTWFKPNMRVFELGGGSGYQASLIAAYGCDVTSFDLADRSAPIQSYFRVNDYDGKHIPFQDKTFDLVFSSNVLEHVRDLPQILDEIRRVLKPGGMAIHILPSSAWRFWTSLSHYAFLIKCLAYRKVLETSPKSARGPQPINRTSLVALVKRALWSGPHGVYPNALSELYYFSRKRWLHVFKKNRFDVIQTGQTHVFYTGYIIFCGIPFTARKIMAKWMGSSCRTYVMRPIPDGEN